MNDTKKGDILINNYKRICQIRRNYIDNFANAVVRLEILFNEFLGKNPHSFVNLQNLYSELLEIDHKIEKHYPEPFRENSIVFFLPLNIDSEGEKQIFSIEIQMLKPSLTEEIYSLYNSQGEHAEFYPEEGLDKNREAMNLLFETFQAEHFLLQDK